MTNAETQPAKTPPDRGADAVLASRAAAGDQEAFEKIMRRNNQLLFRTARSILKNDEDAEDAVQEAYLHAYRGLGSFRADARLSTWLVRIVANEAFGRLRRRSADVIPLDTVIDTVAAHMETFMDHDPNSQPEHAAERVEARKLIEARIDMLPDVFRTVFMLRGVQELTVEETAAALGIPEATVRSRYFRARSMMREGLSRDLDLGYEEAFAFDGKRCDRIVARVMARLSEVGSHNPGG
ncbi:RNA polymerase sigma factor [Georgfuchsia toluolica]|uniref:RNA polymerase sigma factor n=1 Tax=Georgfuchsia toluolica TaxID=424218 RepID=A0A916J0K8_9PROT|nr:RNA polymerase sigma factor [Georgfuchsia toluolica]CAG4882393.1 RNA polymerase sigma factor [Georgfuchsia toluolica]